MMHRLCASLRSAPAAVVLVCVAILSLAAPALAGVHYKADTVITGSQTSRTSVEAWVDGPKAKILFTESDQPMMGRNDYLLTTDGGKTLYLVDPEERTYMEWNLEGMLAAVGSAMESMKGLVNLEFSDARVEKLAEEPGGEVLGYPTTHYRYRTSYTTNVKIMGMKRSSSTETVQDVWTTDAFDEVGLGVWLRNEPPATGIEGLDELIAGEMDKVTGLPLKSRSVSTTTGQKGKQQGSSTTETEVTLIEEVSVPGETFEIPAGYTRQEMVPEEEEDGNPFGRFLKGDGR
jgi:hypothetical protein